MSTKHTHTKSGGVYTALHVGKWVPHTDALPKDMDDVFVQQDEQGNVYVRPVSIPAVKGASVIAGAVLQANTVDFTKEETVVVYQGGDGRLWVRELHEFNVRFDPNIKRPGKARPTFSMDPERERELAAKKGDSK